MIKRKSSVCKIKNKSFYSEKLIKFQGDAKKTQCIMKELIGKRGFDKSSFLQKIATGKTEIVGEIEIANEFNIVLQIMSRIGPKSITTIQTFQKLYGEFNCEMENKPLTVNELKEGFYSL